MKKIIIPLLLNLPAVYLVAGTIADIQIEEPLIAAVCARTTVSLDGKWHYIIDPYQNGYYDYRRMPHDNNPNPGSGAYYTDAKPVSKMDRVEYSFDSSPTMRIPGEWGTQVPELTWYEGSVWFKRDFQLHKNEGKRYFLYFGAANYETHVWVNGHKLGTHVGGFTPFNFEATEVVQEGSNFIVVMVDNKRYEEAVPTVATDWWNHGGITRSVKVVEVPDVFIEDFSLQMKQDGSKLEGWVKLNPSVEGQEVKVTIHEAGISYSTQTDQTGRATIELSHEGINRWKLEDPKRYQVSFASGNDQLVDAIGFRTIETRGEDILLNGKKSVSSRNLSSRGKSYDWPSQLLRIRCTHDVSLGQGTKCQFCSACTLSTQ